LTPAQKEARREARAARNLASERKRERLERERDQYDKWRGWGPKDFEEIELVALARRFEALARVIADPAAYARRLARRLAQAPQRAARLARSLAKKVRTAITPALEAGLRALDEALPAPPIPDTS